jgi:hypothetical protein
MLPPRVVDGQPLHPNYARSVTRRHLSLAAHKPDHEKCTMRKPSIRPAPLMWTTLTILVSVASPSGLGAQQSPDTGAVGPRPQCLLSPTPECIFTLDELTERPDLLYHPFPQYTARIFQKRIKGTLRLLVTLDTTGHPEPGSVVILSTPDSALGAGAGREVLKNVYRPGRIYGRPVRVRWVFAIEFYPPPNMR